MSVPETVHRIEPEVVGDEDVERRGATRYSMGLLPGCQLLHGEPPALLTARVADLSASGVGLLLARPVEPGSVVAIHLGTGPFRAAAAVEARVVYCTPVSDRAFIAGAEFTHPLAPDRLRRLLS